MSNTSSATRKRVPEIALSFEVLEATYRIAESADTVENHYARLPIALREYISELDATTKGKKTLGRVYINPPEDARVAIKWALRNSYAFDDHRVLHVGSLMATYPFIGSILGVIGRQYALSEEIRVPDLTRMIAEVWGATSSVKVGTGKVLTGLRRLGVTQGGGRLPICRAEKLAASPMACAWLTHAVMVTRDVQSIDTHDAAHAPELFWLERYEADADYPHLEQHTEGVNRRVWALR